MNNAKIEYITALYGNISELTAELECINSKNFPYIYELVSDEITRLQNETANLFDDELETFVRAMVEFDDYTYVEEKIDHILGKAWSDSCDIKRLSDGTEIVTNDYFVVIAKDNQVLYYLAR